MSEKKARAKAELAELILFKLNDETFSFNLLNIKEIIEKPIIIDVPQSEDYIAGMINLRGDVITIFNLKTKIGIEPDSVPEDSMVIIVEYQNYRMGVLVDKVQEVKSIDLSGIEDVPTEIAGVSADYLAGVGRIGDKPVLILNIDKIVKLQR